MFMIVGLFMLYLSYNLINTDTLLHLLFLEYTLLYLNDNVDEECA